MWGGGCAFKKAKLFTSEARATCCELERVFGVPTRAKRMLLLRSNSESSDYEVGWNSPLRDAFLASPPGLEPGAAA